MRDPGTSGLRYLMAGAGVLAILLQIGAVYGQSLIGDAPYHLLAGDQALRDGVNVLNLEHPPLAKLLAALPLAGEKRLAPPVDVDRAIPTALSIFDDPARVERLRIRSRFVFFFVFALPWSAACWLLGRQLGGARAGALLALTCALSFNVLPYLTVLQTDTAVALGFVLTAWTALGLLRRPSFAWALGLGAALGLATAAKFSGVLLLPAAAVVLARVRVPWPKRIAWTAAAATVALGFLWTTYAVANRHYDSEAGRRALSLYCVNRGTLVVEDRLRPWEDELLSLEKLGPFPAQWLVGFLGIRAQDALGVYPSYAFGEVDYRGRWWYFPAVLLVKTPLVLLALTAAAALARIRRRRAPSLSRDAVLVVGTITLVYLGTAMTSSYNLGMRHLLPIVPFLLLPAVLRASRSRAVSALLLLFLLAEAVALGPVWMSATNTWWLGPWNPTRTALSHSNFEAHQNFIALRRYAERHALEPLHVLQPGNRPAEIAAYFPAARVVREGDRIVPGWYAVNGTVEQLVPAILKARPEELRGAAEWQALAEIWRPLWEQVRSGEDHGWVAGTYHLYRVTGKPDS